MESASDAGLLTYCNYFLLYHFVPRMVTSFLCTKEERLTLSPFSLLKLRTAPCYNISVVLLPRWVAGLYNNHSLATPPQRERGKNSMKTTQGLTKAQGDHSTVMVTDKNRFGIGRLMSFITDY